MTQRPTEPERAAADAQPERIDHKASDTPADQPGSMEELAGDDEAALRAASPETDPVGGKAASDAEPTEETSTASGEQLLVALRRTEAQRDEYLESLQRAQADFANYRRRIMREGTAQREQGAAEVLTKILDVVDDFELAVLAVQATHEVRGPESATQVAEGGSRPESEPATQVAEGGSHGATSVSDANSIRKGVEMVFGKLIDVLRSFGVEKIGQEGVPFDPELHEAVQTVDDGQPREQAVVVEVLRPGYLLNGRVLRAAMVKVLK